MLSAWENLEEFMIWGEVGEGEKQGREKERRGDVTINELFFFLFLAKNSQEKKENSLVRRIRRVINVGWNI